MSLPDNFDPVRLTLGVETCKNDSNDMSEEEYLTRMGAAHWREPFSEMHLKEGDIVVHHGNIKRYYRDGKTLRSVARNFLTSDKIEMIAEYYESGSLHKKYKKGKLSEELYESGKVKKEYIHGNLFKEYDENGKPQKEYYANGKLFREYDKNGKLQKEYYVNGQLKGEFYENGNIKTEYYKNGKLRGEFFESGGLQKEYSQDEKLLREYAENGKIVFDYRVATLRQRLGIKKDRPHTELGQQIYHAAARVMEKKG